MDEKKIEKGKEESLIVNAITTQRQTKWAIAALFLGLLLASLDQTAVATAMSRAVADLGGMQWFVWVFSAYMIAEVVTMPIAGKLSDMYGRKKVFIWGLCIFLVGSSLCGVAMNMQWLVASRMLQGVGGGVIIPVAFTIAFDLYPPEQRAKMQGLLASVFGLSSIFGPLVGAWFTEIVHWRWIFYVNLPMGIVAGILLFRHYRETVEAKKRRIDWAGLASFTVAIAGFMFVVETAGKQFAWSSPITTTACCISIMALVLFIWVEKRVEEPLIEPSLFQRRLFVVSQVLGFLLGAVMLVFIVYVPLVVQGVHGYNAIYAGFVLIPMMLAVVVSSYIGGKITEIWSYRFAMAVSAFVLVLATAILGFASQDVAIWHLAALTALVGIGIGISYPVLFTSSLHQTEPSLHGSANSLVTFFRSVGGAIGVALLGALQMNQLKRELLSGSEAVFASLLDHDVRAILEPAERAKLSDELLHHLTESLGLSIQSVFEYTFYIAAAILICTIFLGNRRFSEIRGLARPVPVSQTDAAAE